MKYQRVQDKGGGGREALLSVSIRGDKHGRWLNDLGKGCNRLNLLKKKKVTTSLSSIKTRSPSLTPQIKLWSFLVIELFDFKLLVTWRFLSRLKGSSPATSSRLEFWRQEETAHETWAYLHITSPRSRNLWLPATWQSSRRNDLDEAHELDIGTSSSLLFPLARKDCNELKTWSRTESLSLGVTACLVRWATIRSTLRNTWSLLHCWIEFLRSRALDLITRTTEWQI